MNDEQHALPIMHVEQTDSTSALALQELQQGRSLPFAVLAVQQKAGKGQAGRKWLSPRGNLYLSLAVQPSLQHGLSLLVAALVCEWLLARGIAASCKWPNDILYAGKKLGGVLCEGAMQGTRWRYVIVGIGINVNVVPQELQAQATSVREISGQEGKVACWGEQLARYCVAELAKPLTEDEAVVRCERFTSAAAELWQRGTEFYVREPHARGHLQLTSLRTGKTEVLTSSSPDCRLAYQQPSPQPLVVADVGNSTLKLVLFKDERVALTMSVSPHAEQVARAMQKIRPALGMAGKWIIYATAVNRAHHALLIEQAERQDFVVATLHNKPLRMHSDYDLQQLGSDRLAACEAYLAAYGKAIGIVVDFGSATTIDVLDDSQHRGGYILPGLATSLQSLADHTTLPCLTHELYASAPPDYAHTTAAAITRGILHSQVAYLCSLAADLSSPKLVITGRLGEYVTPHLDGAVYDPLLVAKGIRALIFRR